MVYLLSNPSNYKTQGSKVESSPTNFTLGVYVKYVLSLMVMIIQRFLWNTRVVHGVIMVVMGNVIAVG